MNKEIWIHMLSFPPKGDATANRAKVFASIFKSSGYLVNIITIDKNDSVGYEDGYKVYRTANKYFYKNKTFINRLLSNLIYLKSAKRIIKKNKKNIEDSFFLSSSPELIPCCAGMFAKKYKAKFIFDVRDIWPEVGIEMGAFQAKSLVAKIFRLIANKLYKNADLVTTVSLKKKDYLSKYKFVDIKEKLLFIGNGFDEDIKNLTPDFSCLKNIDLDNKFVVSFVGNIGKAQNLKPLFDISQRSYNKKITIIIGGDGADFKSLLEEKEKKQLKNIYFLGRISKEQSLAVTLKSHVSYVSLISDNMIDSVPTKLFESLGLGVPVLLLANGESVEILKESKLGLSSLPSRCAGVPDLLDVFIENYDAFKNHRDECINYIEENHSRQKNTKRLVEYLNNKYFD